MITIEDIAREAGVSHSTVSRALAGSPLVNAATKERIRKLAEANGYQVNRAARSLVTRSTEAIGLIVPEVMNPYFPKVIHLIVQEARREGYSVLLTISGARQEDEPECVRSLVERRADGVILVTGRHGLIAQAELRRLRSQGVPVVILGWAAGVEHVDCVTGDDAAGAYDLTRHLISLGHRRIALVYGNETRGPYDRVVGFRKAMAEAGLPQDDGLYPGVYSEADACAAVDTLISRLSPPTALFAYQDTLAAWTLKHLQGHGIRVPQQIAVVGFDNLDLAEYLNPQLTTVDYPVEAFAEQTVALLVDRIRCGHADTPPRRAVLTPHLVVRSSSGKHL